MKQIQNFIFHSYTSLSQATLYCIIIACSLFPSCTKTNLQSEIDALRQRIEMLESKTTTLNSGIEFLYALQDSSVVIVGVTPQAQGYVIEFSDGSRYHINTNETVEAIVPLLNIDSNGHWTMSLDGGKTFTPIVVDGEYLQAWPNKNGTHEEGAQGLSPRLRIAADGTWEISLDNGLTYTPLQYNGRPINAAGDKVISSLTNIESVSYDAETNLLTVSLFSGETITLPVFNTFGLSLIADSSELFFLGESREIEIVQNNITEATVHAPPGWQAILGEKTLRITAPATPSTQTTPTLSITATSKEGYLKIIHQSLVLRNEELYANACQAWRNFLARNSDNVLLDYSYAGYHHGEEAPPDVWSLGYTVYDVTKYGLDPSGKTSSRAAFVQLLQSLKLTGKNSAGNTQSNATARAILYFPEGDYILHDASDDTKRDTPLVDENGQIVAEYMSSDIVILGGHFVIKGAGRDKTRLIMKTKNYPATTDMWSSPMMLNIKHNSTRIGDNYQALTSVTADAAKGTFSVQVGSTLGITPGSWVMLYLKNNNPVLVAKELAPKSVDKAAMTDIRTINVQDYHQVKSVSGNTVTFYEPLMHEVEAQYGWEIRDFPHYEYVGIEDLTFVGYAKEHFGHHASWEDDGAFKPLNMMRLTNSWIRRVDFQSVSEALTFASTANCSAYDIRITGNRGHSAVRAQASSRVFIGKVIDQSSGYEEQSSSPTPGNAYFPNAGQYHASGVSNPSMGTVLWNNVWGDDAFVESHSKQPRATLVDCGTGGFVQWRFGGDATNVPNHLQDLTLWNMNATRVKHDFGSNGFFKWWLTTNDYWKVLPPIIVGFHGVEAVNFGVYSELAGGWAESPYSYDMQTQYLESNGQAVEPHSLYEAQLRERLGYVPGWLNSLK